MDYKGYTILAEINVNNQCRFEELPNGGIQVTYVEDEGTVDEDNLADFVILDADNERVDWCNTLAEAKQLIDDLVAGGVEAKQTSAVQ